MSTIHHTARGEGAPPIVLVHGFACAREDWDAQVAHLSAQHRTVAVDLRAHGSTPGRARDCTIERFGADVAEVMRELRLPPAVLVGHSMGCRVVIEAALQAPAHTAAVMLVDGSQFAPAIEPVLRERLATPVRFAAATRALFEDMFTPASDKATAAAVIERAGRLPPQIGAGLLLDLVRYDVHRLSYSLAALRVPLMVLQTTFSNEKRERKSLSRGQSTPYLEMVRAHVPAARIEIIPGIGHFPQLDAPAETNALLAGFAASIRG
jgi:pimeloyl-ACP methyl ester carboxylesterase